MPLAELQVRPREIGITLINLRWGMPPLPALLARGQIDPGVTNIRNASSPHWRRWLEPLNRCVVPATVFCEASTLLDPSTGRKVWTWFALGEPWKSVHREAKNSLAFEHDY